MPPLNAATFNFHGIPFSLSVAVMVESQSASKPGVLIFPFVLLVPLQIPKNKGANMLIFRLRHCLDTSQTMEEKNTVLFI
ncbi:hypothetical protein [Virgibacillus senegalensis]|uniref:hypothetical protein n=1 Tax=Virgibacillus senegalensis TaxID=1499679 RepID=UPI00069F3608|nr:hypothetical protein [Virgibacillus senegalensis]